jgi:hypothetical protein
MEEMHGIMDFEGAGSFAEMIRARHTGLMLIHFTNKSLPYPLDCFTIPIEARPANLLTIPYNPHWLEVLRPQMDMPRPTGGIVVSNSVSLVIVNLMTCELSPLQMFASSQKVQMRRGGKHRLE